MPPLIHRTVDQCCSVMSVLIEHTQDTTTMPPTDGNDSGVAVRDFMGVPSLHYKVVLAHVTCISRARVCKQKHTQKEREKLALS